VWGKLPKERRQVVTQKCQKRQKSRRSTADAIEHLKERTDKESVLKEQELDQRKKEQENVVKQQQQMMMMLFNQQQQQSRHCWLLCRNLFQSNFCKF